MKNVASREASDGRPKPMKRGFKQVVDGTRDQGNGTQGPKCGM